MFKDKIMKKCIKNKHKFQIYANHLNSLVFSNKTYATRHKMIVDRDEERYRWFYAERPMFGVAECNILTGALNIDYQMYMKWMLDD